MKKIALARICAVAVLWPIPVFGQISQDHPELCGDKTRAVAAPPQISAVISKSNGTAVLYVGPNRSLELRGTNVDILELCPLSSNKVISFGSNSVGYDVNIVDLVRGAVVDYFGVYDPIMSPNQRWIASRRFYPPQSEIRVSEEYLLYDLDASPSANQHNPTLSINSAIGWAMYPAFPGAAPTDLLDIPDADTHVWRSSSFFWAPDSQSLVFADSVGDSLSLVLVLVKNDKPHAYTYPVSPADVCTGAGPRDLTLEDASINSVAGGVPNILARFEASGSDCQTRPLNLTFNDFQPARVEVYEHRRLKKPTPKRLPQ